VSDSITESTDWGTWEKTYWSDIYIYIYIYGVSSSSTQLSDQYCTLLHIQEHYSVTHSMGQSPPLSWSKNSHLSRNLKVKPATGPYPMSVEYSPKFQKPISLRCIFILSSHLYINAFLNRSICKFNRPQLHLQWCGLPDDHLVNVTNILDTIHHLQCF
jgi:hypothetical protein